MSVSARSTRSAVTSPAVSALNPTLIWHASGPAREHRLDHIEALVSLLDRRPRHHAQKLVAPEADDRVVGAQVSADRAHDALQERVPGRVTVLVVRSLQADNVHVGNREHARRSPGAIDLVVHVRQPGSTRARARQRIGLTECQLAQQGLAVSLRFRAVTSSLLSIPNRLLAVCRGPGVALSRRGAVLGGPLSVLCRSRHDVRPLVVGVPLCVARRELAIVLRRGLVSRSRRKVASTRDGIPGSGRIDPGPGGQPALARAVLAKVTGGVVYSAVGPLRQVTIARLLIGVGCSLVGIGGGLVAVSSSLVRVRERLILIGERLARIGGVV